MADYAHGNSLACLATRSLEGLAELSETFVSKLCEMEPYRSGAVVLTEVNADTESSFEFLLRLIGGLRIPQRLEGISEDIGRRRARSGIPLEVLLQAIRIDFQLIWDLLVRKAESGEEALLLTSAYHVWEALEQHTLQLQAGYLDEKALMGREQEHQRDALIKRLLGLESGNRQLHRQVATALDTQGLGSWVVAMGHLDHLEIFRKRAESLRARSFSAHAQEALGRSTLLVELPEGVHKIPDDWLAGIRCGYAIACDLGTVSRAATVANIIARVAPVEADRPFGLRETWPEIVAEQLGTIGDVLADEVLLEFRQVGPHERGDLEETFAVYLQTGSSSQTGGVLYCHRNTVVNRLQRLQRLTGLSPSIPVEAALLYVALHCDQR